jgi:hypothetical protein
MRYLVFTFCFWVLLSNCGEKAEDINQAENPAAEDLIASFQPVELPFMFQQKDLNKKESDSFFIKNEVLQKFIPDSLFKQDFQSTKGVKFYRKGRYTAEETKETYLFLKAVKKSTAWGYILCFDEKNAYRAGMLLLSSDPTPNTEEEAGLDKRLTVIKTRSRFSKDGKNLYNKSAYVYNTEGLFTLILTESNEPVEEKSVYNPIDTLSSKDPLSGDYKKDKLNFISVRDGGKPGKLNFFIHIEKPNGNCEGSLRGDMIAVKPKVYHYSKADDHCTLEFTFSGKNNVQVRELEACGNHRGVRCSFDGKFRK